MTLKWSFQGTDRVVFDNDRISMDVETGMLTIKNAKQEDSSKYVCRAENGYGEPVIDSAFVDVRMRSKVVQPPKHALLKVSF